MKKTILFSLFCSSFLFSDSNINCYVYYGTGVQEYKFQWVDSAGDLGAIAQSYQPSNMIYTGSWTPLSINSVTHNFQVDAYGNGYQDILRNAGSYFNACTSSGSGYMFDGNGVPMITSQWANKVFSDPSSIIGAGFMMNGLIFTGAGLLTGAALGVTIGSGTAAAIAMFGLGNLAIGGGAALYSLATNTSFGSQTASASSSIQTAEGGRIKINLDQLGNTAITKTDVSGKVTEITTVPKTVVDKMTSATVDTTAKTTSLQLSDLTGIKTVKYDYPTQTATVTDSSPTPTQPTETVPFTVSYGSTDGQPIVTSSNPSSAPSYNGSTGTVSSGTTTGGTTTGGTTSGGTVDGTVPVSDAAGVSGTEGNVSFGDAGGEIDGVSGSSLDSVVSEYTEAFGNLKANFNSIDTAYNNSKSILEAGLNPSRLVIDTPSTCNLSFTMLGQTVPINLSWFSFLYPLFYAIFFIALHYLGIKIYISGTRIGLLG